MKNSLSFLIISYEKVLTDIILYVNIRYQIKEVSSYGKQSDHYQGHPEWGAFL